jgi:Fic family protein
MRFIYERADWPRLTWDSGALTHLLGAVRHRQGLLVGRLAALGLPLRDEAGLDSLTSEIVQSSAIEGEHLPPAEVRSSIARKLGLPMTGLVPSSRGVDGIVQMMLNATQSFAEPLNAERLFAWHAALFPTGRSGMRPMRTGEWRDDRDGPMQVVSGPMGSERVHFEAPAADRVADEMELFFKWVNADEQIDPVLKAGVAHFWFVTIHPFEDGNGRIARAVAEMLLARADGRRERFYSMSAQIESERRDYYTRLERSQRGDLDVTAWLEWFLGCLDRSFVRAERTLESVLFKAWIWDRANRYGLNERQRIVLTRMLGEWHGALTSSKYAKLAKCSPDTALRDIRDLIAAGVLVQNAAGGRSVSYRLVARADAG